MAVRVYTTVESVVVTVGIGVRCWVRFRSVRCSLAGVECTSVGVDTMVGIGAEVEHTRS